MALESASYPSQLNPSYPASTDPVEQGDDHIRLLKSVLKATFPNLTGPMTQTQDFLNALSGQLIPVGAISLYNGSAAPSGWAICDGSTVNKSDGSGTIQTPDLRDRVPVGASASHPLLSTFGASQASLSTATAGDHAHAASTSTAGGHSHGGSTGATALSEAQMPAHNHHVLTLADSGNPINAAPESPVAHHSTYGSNTQAIMTSGGGTWAGISETKGGNQGHAHGIGYDGDHAHGVGIGNAGSHTHSVTVDLIQPSIALNYIMKV